MSVTPFTRLHHVGICVHDLEAALATLALNLGMGASAQRLETDEIRGAVIPIGDNLLEIFSPKGATGSLQRFLERRGDGLHHLAYQVDDIDRALADLAARGARLVDSAARPGLHPGWRIAFVHPESAAGILTELVEVNGPSHG